LGCYGNAPHTEVDCIDGIDNDGDGRLDCEDVDCDGFSNLRNDSTNGETWTAPSDVRDRASAFRAGQLFPAIFEPIPNIQYNATLKSGTHTCFYMGEDSSCTAAYPEGCYGCQQYEELIIKQETGEWVSSSYDWQECTASTEGEWENPVPCTEIENPEQSVAVAWEFHSGLTCQATTRSSLDGDCYVAPTCNSLDIPIMRMVDNTNSQAGTLEANSEIYHYNVCCPVTNVTAVCDAGAARVLTLSSIENAHAEQTPQSRYHNPVCLAPQDGSIFSCAYRESCEENEVCIVSMSGVTNAHVESCSSALPLKVCCGQDVPPAYCGDGVLQEGEQCDDGSEDAGKTPEEDLDGCHDCAFTACVNSTEPPFPGQCLDGSAPRNRCDNEFAQRTIAARTALSGYYGSGDMNKLLFTHKEGVGIRYPAALVRFAGNEAHVGNDLLRAQFQYDLEPEDLTPLEATYLLWIYINYEEEIAEDTLVKTKNFLSRYQKPVGANEEEKFLTLVVRYVYDKKINALSCMNTEELASQLRNKGNNGWYSEPNQRALGEIVVGLSTLYALSDNALFQLLSEMNLDILFSRYGALSTNHVYTGVRAEDTFAAHAYTLDESVWVGWSKLLFGDSEQGVFEPVVLFSEYCVHDAVAGVRDMREVNHDRQLTKETFAGRPGRAMTYAAPEYIISGTLDLSDGVTQFAEGFASRATIRITDDPYKLVSITTVTTNDSKATNPLRADDAQLFMDNSIILGRAGGDSCREPHVFLGNYDELSGDWDGDGLQIACFGVCDGVEIEGSVYIALRFLNPIRTNATEERYAPFSQRVPSQYGGFGDKGNVLYTLGNNRDIFALEVLPESYLARIRSQSQNGPELFMQDVYDGVLRDTLLGFSEGVVTYWTQMSTEFTYEYTLGQSVRKRDGEGNTVPVDTAYEPRHTYLASDTSFSLIDRRETDWLVRWRNILTTTNL